jgi:hypothetical protein
MLPAAEERQAMADERASGGGWSIWAFAFGYFAFYVPYSALTKAISGGTLPSLGGAGLDSFTLLPLSVITSAICMLLFITAMGWWKYASRRTVMGLSLPSPDRWTFFSGLCTSLVIATTTLAYTFEGVSIVFVMLLMRGGVLILAPLVDFLSGRRTRWFSWVGLALSMSALVVAFAERGGFAITLLCAIDVLVYLAAYFVRFRFMSRRAKSDDPNVNKGYFVEEQMVAAPSLVIMLALVALLGSGSIAEQVSAGFTDIFATSVLFEVILIGAFSQGTGIFGSLIFLDARENTFCIPVNRSSSIIAGVVASYSLYWALGESPPSTHSLVGAGLIVVAIVVLAFGPRWKRRPQIAMGAPG